MKILVVDDDASALEIRRLVLERRGHTVATASTPAEARARFAQGCDAVLMDLRIPELDDGLALIREFQSARIIVLCGNRGDLAGREEERMVAAVLEKPIRSEVLLNALGS